VPTFRFEKAVLKERPDAVVAGIDEAGRGPWAGPVLASAVILNVHLLPRKLRSTLDDSKKVSPEKREELFAALIDCGAAVIGIGRAEVREIDSINILNATYRAMARALEEAMVLLGKPIDMALVDGNRAPPLPCPVRTIVSGDALCLSIAAASIVAKVTRDRFMRELALTHPGYGWETNVGYGTEAHRDGIERHGLTPHHRRSFAPVRDVLRAQLDGVRFQESLI